jgi:cell division protein FtsQ
LPRSRTRLTLAILLGVAAVGVAGWGVTTTPLFDLKNLSVTGNRHLSQADVARVAGLSSATNVLWLRTGPLADLIERDPWVLRASVTRTLPGTVTVSIQERSAVAVGHSGRSRFLVSGDGMVLGRAPAGAAARLPAISLSGITAVVGTRMPRLPATLVVARTLPPRIRAKVERIVQAGQDSLTVVLRNGVQVLYGDASDADAKGETLASLLSWATRRGIRAGSIDLRSPAAPALRPAEPAMP